MKIVKDTQMENPYKAARVIAQRAEAIMQGSMTLTDTYNANPVSQAIDEYLEGLIKVGKERCPEKK